MNNTVTVGNGLDLMSAAGRNRKERRRLAKVNGIAKISGTMRPNVSQTKKEKDY